MRVKGIRVALALGAAIAALGVLGLILGQVGTRDDIARHPDGGGPLASTDDPWSMGLDPQNEAVWSQGIYVCSLGGEEVILESVAPTGGFGSFRYLGSRVREFTPSGSDNPIFSNNGFPPNVPDDLQTVDRYHVTAGCSLDERSATYTEILLGIGRVGDSGGGWTGEEVSYRVGDRRYILELKFAIAVCGSAIQLDTCPKPS